MSAPHGNMDHAHHFDSVEHEFEAGKLGMWLFLVTEVMFFGALFFIYTLYQTMYQKDFYLAHEELSVPMGGFNTVVLLISSWTMAVAVRHAQLHASNIHDERRTRKERRSVLVNLTITLVCAAIFLGVKWFEYAAKFEHHLYPGTNFGTHLEHLNDVVLVGLSIHLLRLEAQVGGNPRIPRPAFDEHIPDLEVEAGKHPVQPGPPQPHRGQRAPLAA